MHMYRLFIVVWKNKLYPHIGNYGGHSNCGDAQCLWISFGMYKHNLINVYSVEQPIGIKTNVENLRGIFKSTPLLKKGI